MSLTALNAYTDLIAGCCSKPQNRDLCQYRRILIFNRNSSSERILPLASLQITAEDVSTAQCTTTGDPHLRTFDGL